MSTPGIDETLQAGNLIFFTLRITAQDKRRPA